MTRKTLRLLCVAAALGVALAPAMAQVKKWDQIKYPKLAAFTIPKPEVFTLSNGMTVFLLEDHEIPLIDVSTRIRTGSQYEPADKVGLATLMATVQRSGGTQKMSGDQIDEFLSTRAASIETGMDVDAGFASMNCLKDDFDAVLALFQDVLRQPAFAQEKIDVAKVQLNAGIARRNDNVNGIAARESNRLVYGPDSPFARMMEFATIASVKRDDLVAWHGKFYHPNNMSIGVVGDFDSKAMRSKLETAFGSWQKGAQFSEKSATWRTQPTPGVFFVEKSDVNQANIVLAHLGIETKAALAAKQGNVADYYAVQVANEILGGGFASRLFSNVRSKKGLAYNVYGGLGTAHDRPGVFRVGLQTKSSTMTEAVEALKVEIRGMLETPPSEAEIQRAKESILNSFIFNYDSKEEVLQQQMAYAYYGMPADFLEQYRSNIEKVTKDDVARVAKKYMRPDQLTVLVVGKAADFDKPVDSLGAVTKLDVTIPGPPDSTPKIAKTAEGVDAGKKVFSRMVAALGGKAPEGVNAIRTTASMQVNMGGQAISLGRDVLLVFPDKIRQVQKTPMGEVVAVIKGGEGFMQMGGQLRPLPAEQVQAQMKELNRDLRMLVYHHADPTLEALAAGQDDVNGTKCDVVAVTFKGADSRLCVDASGKVVKQSYQGSHPMTGVPGQFEVFYSDYRDQNGRQVPFKEVIKIDGEDAITFTLEKFEVNPQIEMAQFDKPAA